MSIEPKSDPARSKAAQKRILIGKAGMDKHDRGAIIVSRALRDAGYEIIYVGPGHTPEEVARIAVDEDVDALGLSLLSGAHLQILADLHETLGKLEADDMVIFAGGTIADDDIPRLEGLGVRRAFMPGTPLRVIVAEVDRILDRTPAGADGEA